MPEYRRPWIPGGSYFITVVTYRRQPLFTSEPIVQLWRDALTESIAERSFTIDAGVILPDHIHLLIKLPAGDPDISSRIGRAKSLFTKKFRQKTGRPLASAGSRKKHREAEVWQRRFYDHLIRDDEDFTARLEYIHYNPVKHGHVQCPADWPWSSFHHWVNVGAYPASWCCGNQVAPPNFSAIDEHLGE